MSSVIAAVRALGMSSRRGEIGMLTSESQLREALHLRGWQEGMDDMATLWQEYAREASPPPVDVGGKLVTPEMARAIVRNRSDATNWERQRSVAGRAVALALMSALLMWVLSWTAAGLEGAVGRSYWFQVFSIVTFLAAMAATVTLAGCVIWRVSLSEPPAPRWDEITGERISS